VHVVEPDLARMGNPATPGVELNPHGMDPVRVLSLALSMGPVASRIIVVGCGPGEFGEESGGHMGLSKPVRAAVEEASDMVQELAIRLLARNASAQIRMQKAEEKRKWEREADVVEVHQW
jgi:hydrogenase maturation protease